MRNFGYSSRYVGPNDMIRQERKEKQKHGMKRHFYDREILDKLETPSNHFRAGMTEKDLKGRSDQVRQCFSLNNGSDREMYSAKYLKIKDMLG
mmetsp:Transcript_15839/g.19943  ORF Transcript_15839/g.19943 Transcript_15839/m.19943 type:complete len:93 (-) Transcript_15839:380-658(-)|eukprot:CAMPEP_0170466166 /NCGR_PEP_ID=MMETSP0123-20130129/10230_1 /TAXON_ID=182087 /ORGANISM="Favella ehrenbergii, Strain Fehren 1" /LENGTH=92 /DNA_ID=CAMNT_0010732231 /DNA_START=106 /DNA_END=384 /DNA_ORIENTATION=-